MDDPPEAHSCPCGRDARAPGGPRTNAWLNHKDDGASMSSGPTRSPETLLEVRNLRTWFRADGETGLVPGGAGVPPAPAGGRQWTIRRRPTIVHAGGTPALPGGLRRGGWGCDGVDAAELSDTDRTKIFEDNARRVFPRLGA